MGRLFTFSFQYQSKTYEAVVVMSCKENDVSIGVRIPDHSLYHLLPEGKLTYNSKQGVLPLQFQDKSRSQELIQCIIGAADRHLLLMDKSLCK